MPKDYTITDRIVLLQGNDLRMRFPVYDQQEELVDISDYSELHYAIYDRSVDSVIYSDDDTGNVYVGGGNYELIVELSGSDTSEFSKGLYRHEAWIVNDSGETYHIVRGYLKVVDTLIDEV